MTTLRPCSRCQRHIRTEEKHCPFCEAAPTSGKLARAAVVATALAGVSSMGCSKEEKKSEAPPVEDPAPVFDASAPGSVPIDAALAKATTDAGVPDAMPVDAASPDAAAKKRRKKPKEQKVLKIEAPIDREPPPMPYGAPPARHRLV